MSASKKADSARGKAARRTDTPEQSNGRHDASTPATGLSAPKLWTPEQLAERLQVTKAQVYRLTRRGAIPAVRLGKYYRYRKDEIERWEREGGTDG